MHRPHVAAAHLSPITAMPPRLAQRFSAAIDRDTGRCQSRCAPSTLPGRFRLL